MYSEATLTRSYIQGSWIGWLPYTVYTSAVSSATDSQKYYTRALTFEIFWCLFFWCLFLVSSPIRSRRAVGVIFRFVEYGPDSGPYSQLQGGLAFLLSKFLKKTVPSEFRAIFFSPSGLRERRFSTVFSIMTI